MPQLLWHTLMLLRRDEILASEGKKVGQRNLVRIFMNLIPLTEQLLLPRPLRGLPPARHVERERIEEHSTCHVAPPRPYLANLCVVRRAVRETPGGQSKLERI